MSVINSQILSTSITPSVSQIVLPSPSVSQVLPVAPQLSQVMTVPVAATAPQVVADSQPVIQPIIQQVIEQPIIQPIYVPQGSIPQIPQMSQTPTPPPTIVPPPPPKPLMPSPTYDKFIPPSPLPTSLPRNAPPKIYQFYKQVPTPQATPITGSFIQGPAYQTVSMPAQSVVGMPQYTTFSYI